MSAATPLALFALGYVVTQSSAEEALNREAAARQDAREREAIAEAKVERREKQRASEALDRDKQNREQARRDGQLAREESRRDAKLARDEAFTRERILYRETEAQAERVRYETWREKQWERLLDLRHEGWSKIGPLVSELYNAVESYANQIDDKKSEDWADEVISINDDITETFDSYYAYFGKEFDALLVEFQTGCAEVIRSHHDNSDKRRSVQQERVDAQFNRVMSAASYMLSVPDFETREPVPVSGEPVHIPLAPTL